MARNTREPFRTTPWPAVAVDVPDLVPLRLDVAVADLALTVSQPERYREAARPFEWFLRGLFETDLDDIEALVVLTASHGPISPWGREALSLMPTWRWT